MSADLCSYDRNKEVLEFDESKLGVKTLSDSGITSIPRIFVHPPKTISGLQNNYHNHRSSSAGIPIIDLSGVHSPNHRSRIVEQVRESAAKWGFFQIISHGVPLDVMGDTISAIKAFHKLPTEVKSRYYVRDERRAVKFVANYDLLKSPAACWHDSLVVRLNPEPPNHPNEIPKVCRKEILEWDLQATKVAEIVEGLLAEGLGLEAGKFKELTLSDAKVFTGCCYPYCPQPDLTMGFAPRTDSRIFTVLLPNQVPGLQARHGQYQSVQHRVLANSSKEMRISVIVFFSLLKWKESDTMYGPLPELLSPERRNFTKQEFFEIVYAKGFDSKTWIEKIKIRNP